MQWRLQYKSHSVTNEANLNPLLLLLKEKKQKNSSLQIHDETLKADALPNYFIVTTIWFS